MKNMFSRLAKSSLIALAACLAFTQVSRAQINYRVAANPTMMLNGTSTLHNWDMVSHAFSANAQFSLANNQLTGLSALTVVLPVHNLKSEHDGMNDNAYETLNADKYREIVFRLTSARVTSAGGNKYQILATGNLTISGVTRAVTLNTSATLNNDGSISCVGTVPLKLSEFNIERPSFMLGTMKVGDALSLSYNLVFVK